MNLFQNANVVAQPVPQETPGSKVPPLNKAPSTASETSGMIFSYKLYTSIKVALCKVKFVRLCSAAHYTISDFRVYITFLLYTWINHYQYVYLYIYLSISISIPVSISSVRIIVIK